MGIFDSNDFFLGPGGSAALGTDDSGANALSNFEIESGRIAGGLGAFQGFQTTSPFGQQSFFQQGNESRLDINSPEFQRILSEFNKVSQAGSSGILEKLRARAAPGFSRAFGELESGTLAKGRLGLDVGDRGGIPEFEQFFGQKNQADLGFQLQAEQEFSAQKQGLLSQLFGIQGFLQQDLQAILGSQQGQTSRDIAAGNLEQGGLEALLAGQLGEAERGASLFNGAISSLGVGPVSATF